MLCASISGGLASAVVVMALKVGLTVPTAVTATMITTEMSASDEPVFNGGGAAFILEEGHEGARLPSPSPRLTTALSPTPG
jgi:hypothetical protein